ncbi:glycoside hydrolase family 25 protein [Rhizobium sp. G187]|uniref:glycoside hydrolase family 25 protein n=1 Tax=unclassified Rhizobium TaxID=2613769 RepID=UPI0006B8A6F4|nr:GH25 family lysozyme [Rhizobium sp. AAP43]KPF42085.1 glycosyl hydrolase [Rhizobium sp. AAP43]
MRSKVIPSLLVGCMVLTSCSARTNPVEILRLRNQPATQTAQAAPPPAQAPMPAVAVDEQTASITPSSPVTSHPEALAWAGNGQQQQHFEASPMTAGMPVPDQRPVSRLVPPTPAVMAPEEPAASSSGGRHRVYSQRFRDAKPINFGKVKPKHHAVHGVDVSRWQANIDWKTLRGQGANFAYIKATDGGDHVDPMFRTNWDRAKAAGLKRGAYHFFYWCRVASDQADWFIRNVPRDPDALPPVIDVEYNGESSCRFRLSPEKAREKMQVFMDRLERHYGKRPVIYTAPDFYKDNLRGHFLDYPFWLRSVAAHPSKTYPGRKWVFWQYSGSGLSQGVNGKIDLNVFYGSVKDWQRWVDGKTSWENVAGLR